MSAEGEAGRQIPEKLARIVDTVRGIGERNDRIELLISIADRFQEVPPTVAVRPYDRGHLVPHCESEAFVWSIMNDDGTLKFYFAVENPQGISARAMAVILDETLSGAPLAEVAAVPEAIAYEIFGKELSMGKSMGLTSMIALVRAAAREFLVRSSGRADKH